MVPSAAEKLEEMLNGPAQRPPPNVKPNFVNPWSMKYGGAVALYTILAVCTLVFVIHIYTQLRIGRKFIWEDRLLVLTWVSPLLRSRKRDAFVLSLAQVVLVGAYTPVGALLVNAPMGVHQWNITLRGFGRYLFVS
jgi:hypothetical protein